MIHPAMRYILIHTSNKVNISIYNYIVKKNMRK